jgi:hypothetical protein
MPTRPKKGGGEKQNPAGSSKRGSQKAVVGSSRTPGAVPDKEPSQSRKKSSGG